MSDDGTARINKTGRARKSTLSSPINNAKYISTETPTEIKNETKDHRNGREFILRKLKWYIRYSKIITGVEKRNLKNSVIIPTPSKNKGIWAMIMPKK
ncbi:hypothetical protein [Rhizobium sp. BK418]|uniref:hypothetical protein n=1 Tax=Rhizobium sp. BK418 TaxID=2512120 RepID=UPI00104CE545|nr:hypothetical protein [Rhizobium sp. BK418]